MSARIPGPDVVEIGKPMTVRITVTGEMGSDPAPSGTVTVKVDGLSLETATPESLAGTLDEQGMATIVVPESLTSTLQPGPLTLYAAYVGDNGYQEARASADFQVLAKGSGYVPPPADSPAGKFVRDYRPIKGFAYEPQPSDWAGTDPGTSVNFDSDYYNADFRKLWGPEGRDDLGTMADIGVNLVHIYNWNPGRKYHEAFLSYAAQKGIGVTIPISNYTDCLLAGNDCQGVKGPGSYRNAYSNIEKIFNQVYAGKKPRPGAAMWLVYNEFDETYREGKPIPADSVLFSIQSILQLEKDNGIAPEDRLAISVTTTTSGKFGPAQGIGPTQDVRDVLRKSAEAGGTRTWRGGDGQAVTLDAIPDGFWQRRYIASTNPFQDATALAKMINTTWPNAFKGGDKWSDLPPMFFGETGFSAADFGGSYDRTAEAIRSTLTCTNPIAAGNGFFLGSAIFEYSEENRKAGHGVQGYAKPPRKTTAETTKEWDGGAQTQKTTYTVDALTPYPTWDAVKQGFASTTSTCPQ